MSDSSEAFNQDDFLQALDPNNWSRTDRFHTPTFDAILDQTVLTLLFSDGVSKQIPRSDVEALTRFLTQHVQVQPLVLVEDDSLFAHPRLVIGPDGPVQEDEGDEEYPEYLPLRHYEQSGDYNEFVKE